MTGKAKRGRRTADARAVPVETSAAALALNDHSDPEITYAANGVAAGDLTLHELFAQQAASLLERADLDEEQKTAIMVAMSCPCCGGGSSISLRVPLKKDAPPRSGAGTHGEAASPGPKRRI